MLLRRFTDIYPKELARDRREFFNSLLGRARSRGLIRCGRGVPARSLCSKELGNCLANTGTATSDDSDLIIQHEIQSAAGGTFRVSHNLELSLGPSGTRECMRRTFLSAASRNQPEEKSRPS